MRVLIIGCGYVGLPLGLDLARAGHEVFGLRRTAAMQPGFEPGGIRPLTGDITNPEGLAKLPGRYDWVVNCVASGGGSADDYRQVYLEGMRNVIGWLGTTPPRKLVYTSSTGVYGQNDGSTVTETSPAEPAAEIGQVLVQAENVLLDAARQHGFPGVVLRLGGIYGPGRGYWLKQYLRGEAVIEGRGERILNMIHRDDVVGCIIAALEKGRAGEVYNAVDDEPVTQLALFEWLAGALGKPLPPFGPAEGGSGRRRGATNKRVSNQKIKAVLGYRFKYPTFREGLLTGD